MSAWQNSDELPLEILDLMTREAGSCLAAVVLLCQQVVQRGCDNISLLTSTWPEAVTPLRGRRSDVCLGSRSSAAVSHLTRSPIVRLNSP